MCKTSGIPHILHRTIELDTCGDRQLVAEAVPLGRANFREIRGLSGAAYFDKSKFIYTIEEGPPVQLVCRPRRFRKSLNISMLQSFHGVEFRAAYDRLFGVCGCQALAEPMCVIYVHTWPTLESGSRRGQSCPSRQSYA